VPDHHRRQVPAGVRAIAVIFALCGIYLAIAGLLMLFLPGAISMTAGAPLLFGLELAGPYMFLLMALLGGAVSYGLLRLNNITRHLVILIAITGVVMLIPPVSAAAVLAQPKALAFGGIGIIIRVIIAWYLSQGHIADQFKTKAL
jgi:hypothetical protein